VKIPRNSTCPGVRYKVLVGVVIEPALEQRSADSSINALAVAKSRLLEWHATGEGDGRWREEDGRERVAVTSLNARPRCGQINAFPLRTNKFPRDADDNNKCQQKTKILNRFLSSSALPFCLSFALLPTARSSRPRKGERW